MSRPLLAVAAAATFFVTGSAALADRDHGHHKRAKFELLETTIPEIRQALRSRVISAERLTRMYLKRIEAYEETGPRDQRLPARQRQRGAPGTSARCAA